MKNKSNASKASLNSGTSITLKKGDSIDLSEASLSLEGATLGISLDGETSTNIKIEAK